MSVLTKQLNKAIMDKSRIKPGIEDGLLEKTF